MYEAVIDCKRCGNLTHGDRNYKVCPHCGNPEIEKIKILSIDEAAALKKTSRNTISNWAKQQKINTYTIHGRTFVIMDEALENIFPKSGPRNKTSFLQDKIEELRTRLNEQEHMIEQHAKRFIELEKRLSALE